MALSFKHNIDQIHDEAISFLRQLIEIPSISRDEGRTADLIEDFLVQNGVEDKPKGQ